MAFQRTYKPSLLTQGWEDQWALLPGGPMTRLGPSALGLRVQTLLKAWLSA